jgi:phospholipid/cholesterol/gamma-HCH transport system substrate-binding protein
MMQSRMVEIWVGLFVAAGIAALIVLALQVSNLSAMSSEAGYTVTARFENVSGLHARSPVTIAGVRIGRVSAIHFDPQTYEAVVTMNIEPGFDQLPEDSDASILTAGLLGEKYIGINPGGSTDYLRHGSEITMTQSSLVLERLIGQFLFSQSNSDK